MSKFWYIGILNFHHGGLALGEQAGPTLPYIYFGSVTDCVTLGKLFLSEPWFLHTENGDNNSIYLRGFWGEAN